MYLSISVHQCEIGDKDSNLHINTHFCKVFYTEPQWMNNCKARELCTPCPCKQIVKIVWTISGVAVVLNYFRMPVWNLYWALDLNLDECIDTAFLHSFLSMNPNEWIIAKLANSAHHARKNWKKSLYLFISEHQCEIRDKDSNLHINTHFWIVFHQWTPMNRKASALCTS